MHFLSRRFAALLSLALVAHATAASADDAPTEPAPAPSSSSSSSSSASAPAEPTEPGAAAREPSASVALERIGGIGYVNLSQGNSSVSATTVGVGGPTLNPYAVPRLGLDYITSSGVTIGAAAGLSITSISADGGGGGTIFLYSLTPRVGYRAVLSKHVDLVPRAGITIAGASGSISGSSDSGSVLAIAASVDAPFVFRVTDSFNLLAGVGIDYTLSASASGDSGGSGGSQSQSFDGSLFALQGWLGIGGYL